MTVASPAQDPTAVSVRRILSYVIDFVVLMWVVPAIFFLLTADLTYYTDSPDCGALTAAGVIDGSWACDSDGTGDTVVYKNMAVVIALGVLLLYGIAVMWIAQGLTGATLGKAVTGVRTVNADGQPPGVGTQGLRGIGGIADMFPWGCAGPVPLVGMITMLATKDHRRVGDMVAKTYVVRTAAAGSPIVLPEAATTPAPTAPPSPYAAPPPATDPQPPPPNWPPPAPPATQAPAAAPPPAPPTSPPPTQASPTVPPLPPPYTPPPTNQQ